MKRIQALVSTIIAIIGFVVAASIILPGLLDIVLGTIVGWAFLSLASAIHYNDDLSEFIQSTKAWIKQELRS